MRRTSALVPVLVAAILAAGAVHAQESPTPSGSPGASAVPRASAAPSASVSPSTSPVGLTDPCELWTADEVSVALGGGEFSIEPESAGPSTCAYVGKKKAGDLTQSIVAGIAFGDDSTGSLLDLVRQNFPDAEELDLGGVIAIQGTTYPGAGKAKGWSMGGIYLFPDPMIMVQGQATAPKGVEVTAALESLATLAAPRIATIQRPTASPSPSTTPAASPAATGGPAPSGDPITGLAGFPAQVGGRPTSIERDLTGPEYLAQIINFKPMEQKITKALKKNDKKAGDLRFVVGGTPSGSVIAAFQVKGGPIKPLVNVLLESLAMERSDQAVPPEDVAGKDAFGISGGFLIGTPGVAYAKDDTLWLIFSFSPEQAEILELLP